MSIKFKPESEVVGSPIAEFVTDGKYTYISLPRNEDGSKRFKFSIVKARAILANVESIKMFVRDFNETSSGKNAIS